MERKKSERIMAIWDEYNHSILPPDLAPCVQPRHQVPKHGCRLIMEERDER